MTVEEFARLWRERRVSAQEVTDTCLQAIERDNPRLNAFILVTAEEARQQARIADEELASGLDRGPLHGVPFSLKDLFDVDGQPTTAASHVRDGHVATSDAALVNTLRHAGAVLIGKTNLHEFALGTTNEESGYGPVRNPIDPARVSGGSSGGSAVSVATGMALATLGTDTGGSIRIPAAACGIVGLKPTYDELSCDGVVPLSKTLDHAGPLTQTVTDAAIVYQVLRGLPAQRTIHARAANTLRLAIPTPYFLDAIETDVRRSFEQAIEQLRAAGATIGEVTINHVALTPAVYVMLAFGDAAPYHAVALDTMPERYTEPVRLRLETARYVLAEDYVRALAGRDLLRRSVDAALSGYDALILPTLPLVAPALGTTTVEIAGRQEPVRNAMLRLTQLFNVTGHPAISLPIARSSTGLPVGLQLVGTRMQTSALLTLARTVEQTLGALSA
ncbi:MAG: amidase [Acidobacteriaceae bacterium]|jgi:aspartyl-tRNA(Asn)/glutamyl-tRNA(Gln) amidotransferase subunit A|nr:amidase [Acidobacteriaceae bacterium]